MAWSELRVAPVPRGLKDVVANALFQLGAQGAQEDYLPGQAPPPRQPWDTGPLPPEPKSVVVKGWFEDEDRAAVERALAPVFKNTQPMPELTWSAVDETDWSTSWQAHFPALQVTERIRIVPPWEDPTGAIVIEPGQGFGTGQHPTTVGALRLMDPLLDEATSLLDVGCGSGVLAIAAAKFGVPGRGVDIAPEAVDEALRNAERNGVSIHFDQTPVAKLDTPADLVVSNVFAEALAEMASDLVRLTGRWLVLAGVLADREHLVRDALDPHLDLDERTQDGEWVNLRYLART